MAQLGANGYAGTAAVVIPSTGGLHIQPYSGNSASWPHGGGNALAITDSGWPPGATLILSPDARRRILGMGGQAFEVNCEIEPATTPHLRRVRHQIGVLSAVSSIFLIPDHHIGRATVSSIAVAHEVINMGGRQLPASTPETATLWGSAVTC